MSADTKGPKILARTFFEQLQRAGYNSNQIIGVATELIDLVTENLKGNAARASLPAGGGAGQAIQPQPQ